MNVYLDSVQESLHFLKNKGDRTIKQLNYEELHWRPNEESNSLAIIVKHLNGNMVSRWTDFLSADGEKPWRKRDAEFEGAYSSKEELFRLVPQEVMHICVIYAMVYVKKLESIRPENMVK